MTFDCVVHSILLKRLVNCGILVIANDIIICSKHSCLSGRTQALFLPVFSNKCVQDAISTYLTNVLGVPQGAHLGLLFIIYINNLPQFTSQYLPVMFADMLQYCLPKMEKQKLNMCFTYKTLKQHKLG